MQHNEQQTPPVIWKIMTNNMFCKRDNLGIKFHHVLYLFHKDSSMEYPHKKGRINYHQPPRISAPDLMHSEDILLPYGSPHQCCRCLGSPAHHEEGPIGGSGGGDVSGQLGFAPQATSGVRPWGNWALIHQKKLENHRENGGNDGNYPANAERHEK